MTNFRSDTIAPTETAQDHAEAQPRDLVSQIIDYEAGELSEDETIALFQELVDSGQAWRLQGSYGRTAHHLIEAGYVTLPDGPVEVSRGAGL